jgi:hypothetical protein
MFDFTGGEDPGDFIMMIVGGIILGEEIDGDPTTRTDRGAREG